MNVLTLLITFLGIALGPLLCSADMGSFFKFSEPVSGSRWVDGQENSIVWEKGLLDGVPMFDLELARLSEDGVIKAALNVPALAGSLFIQLNGVPAGDDYYLLFINSTHGGMYAISPRFTILESGGTANSSATATAGASTITVSGGPNPTLDFATTFPAISGGVLAWRVGAETRNVMLGLLFSVIASVLGAAWTIL